MRPPDAEKLLRACGVKGDRSTIQSYLAASCDNHPLVIGILGGLIRNYLPARGDFDVWVGREDGGAKLDLGSLDLVQRRNDILRAAFEALPPGSRQLLSTLALLTQSVDYETLEAFSPHVPAEPAYAGDPGKRPLRDDKRKEGQWKKVFSSPEARQRLQSTVRDLEIRGLLQFDDRTNRYDLHPVVRGAIFRFQRTEERDTHGQRIVDHFSSMTHRPVPRRPRRWRTSGPD